MTTFVATYRVSIEVPTQVEADVALESLAIKMEEYIETEADTVEQVRLTEVVAYDAASTWAELVVQMRAVRNRLIATKGATAYELAKQLDFLAWHYEQKIAPNDISPAYDHARIFDIAKAVWNGENPTT